MKKKSYFYPSKNAGTSCPPFFHCRVSEVRIPKRRLLLLSSLAASFYDSLRTNFTFKKVKQNALSSSLVVQELRPKEREKFHDTFVSWEYFKKDL